MGSKLDRLFPTGAGWRLPKSSRKYFKDLQYSLPHLSLQDYETHLKVWVGTQLLFICLATVIRNQLKRKLPKYIEWTYEFMITGIILINVITMCHKLSSYGKHFLLPRMTGLETGFPWITQLVVYKIMSNMGKVQYLFINIQNAGMRKALYVGVNFGLDLLY